MKSCPVCGRTIPNVNNFCSLACYKSFKNLNTIPESDSNLKFGGDF